MSTSVETLACFAAGLRSLNRAALRHKFIRLTTDMVEAPGAKLFDRLDTMETRQALTLA